MSDISMEQWIREDLNFINTKANNTFNGRMKPEFHSCSETDREVILSFDVQDWEINGIGTLHGGVSAAMADFTMSLIAHYFAQEAIPPTISQSINFMKPVPQDSKAHVYAKITSMSRRVASVYSEVRIAETGKLACTSIGTYSVKTTK